MQAMRQTRLMLVEAELDFIQKPYFDTGAWRQANGWGSVNKVKRCVRGVALTAGR